MVHLGIIKQRGKARIRVLCHYPYGIGKGYCRWPRYGWIQLDWDVLGGVFKFSGGNRNCRWAYGPHTWPRNLASSWAASRRHKPGDRNRAGGRRRLLHRGAHDFRYTTVFREYVSLVLPKLSTSGLLASLGPPGGPPRGLPYTVSCGVWAWRAGIVLGVFFLRLDFLA